MGEINRKFSEWQANSLKNSLPAPKNELKGAHTEKSSLRTDAKIKMFLFGAVRHGNSQGNPLKTVTIAMKGGPKIGAKTKNYNR